MYYSLVKCVILYMYMYQYMYCTISTQHCVHTCVALKPQPGKHVTLRTLFGMGVIA